MGFSYISVMSRSYSKTEEAKPNCCSKASAELKLYQAFIFMIPIVLILLLLLLFYLFYLRRRRVDWRSLRMRASSHNTREEYIIDITTCELGLKKEHRETLPVVVFKEIFSVKEMMCPVCLADYLPEDRLHKLPACEHTFHMGCINLWLVAHTTCPLCRLSLIPSTKHNQSADSPETIHIFFSEENSAETTSQGFSQSGIGDTSDSTRN